MTFGKYSQAGLALSMAPLYAGPLLAGWIGAPVILLLALAEIFFLAQLLANKEQGRGNLPLPAFLVMLAGAQLFAVAVVFGLGVVLRLVAGPVALPLWVPLVISALGGLIYARRYKYDPVEQAALDDISQAIDTLETMVPDETDPDEPHR